MIEQQQKQQLSQMPQMGMPSHLPPPTPYFNPYDPYMSYSSLYQMPPMMMPPNIPPSTPHSFNMPPPTPTHMMDVSQQQQPQMQMKQEKIQQIQQPYQVQQQQHQQQMNNNLRNTSISSFKELEFDNRPNENIIEPKRERLTPLMHQRPHVKAIFGLNSIIQIKANDPCEGQPALVEIHNLTDLVEDNYNEDPNYKILQEFPGPLMR